MSVAVAKVSPFDFFVKLAMPMLLQLAVPQYVLPAPQRLGLTDLSKKSAHNVALHLRLST